MKLRSYLPLAVLAMTVVLTAGCQTDYGPRKGVADGYSDYQIRNDLYSVRFRANQVTSMDRIERFLLRRASEVTLENDFTYFSIQRPFETSEQSQIGWFGVRLVAVTPERSIWIRCYHDQPGDGVLAIDAQDYLDNNFPPGWDEEH